VRPDYPADRAGLRDGDYILEVNGESIDSIEHDSVVSKISAQPTQVDLLVVADLQAYLESQTKIIICVVTLEGEKPLGLSLSTATNRSQSRASSASSNRKLEEDVILPIITSVDAGSPADKSGLKANDLILEINGRSTTGQTNNTVGKWIRSSGEQIEFLVSRENAHKFITLF
jgi:C-terminal processing protease CtpA/Prc